MDLCLVGISHHTAPLEVREQVVFDQTKIGHDLSELSKISDIQEVALLSTCNRIEIYCCTSCPSCTKDEACESGCHISQRVEQELIHYLQRTSRSSVSLAPFTYHYRKEKMIQHLMAVAGGLNSMMIGEPQILGQMKNCIRLAQKANTAKSVLSRLFQHTFSAAKQVRHSTGIGRHPVSVARTAIYLTTQFFDHLDQQHIVLIGAGETIRQICEYLKRQNANRYQIVNRHPEAALHLVDHDSSRVHSIDNVAATLAPADIVISATASQEPIISKAMVEKAIASRTERRLLIIDLAVPRDVDPALENVDQVYLYTVDDLANIIDQSVQERHRESSMAHDIIKKHQQIFMSWLHTREHIHSIQSLRQKANLSTEKLKLKAQRQLAAGRPPEQVIDELAHKMKHTLLHPPTMALKEAIETKNTSLQQSIESIYQLNKK